MILEAAFRDAQRIIAAARGYVSHELQRCLEKPDQYILLVRWQNFYDPFPTVEHYVTLR